MIIVFVGPPGCGKGTQAARLCADLGVPHVSTGDILRAEAQAGSRLGRRVEPLLRAGELVPDELVIGVVVERLCGRDAAKGAVLDGFPRTAEQAAMLDEFLIARGRRVELVVAFHAGEATILERLLSRANAMERSDDTHDTIRRRYAEYNRMTLPVIGHYASKATRVAKVDAEQSIDLVRTRLCTHVAAAAASLGDLELTGRVIPLPPFLTFSALAD